MKINLYKHGFLIVGFSILAYLIITSCTITPTSVNQAYLNELRTQQETAQKAREARGTILLYSDYAGTVLINGNETQFTAIAENEVSITIENAIGNEYTLAVRDSAGIVHHASNRILIEENSNYFASIININPGPNASEDFGIMQNANGITITSYNGTRRRVIIPETLHGQSVTAIGNEAFRAKGIVSVIIPNSIVSIGNYAFTNSNSGSNNNVINEVVIPDSVISIGSDAFSSCGLTKVTIGRGVRFIDDNAFGRLFGKNESSDNKISELIVLAPLTAYDRRVTGRRYDRTWGLYIDEYSQTLGLHPNAFGGGLFNRNSLLSLTRVTLPANIHDDNLEVFPEGLVGYYKSQGKRAGTYVLNGPVWARE